MKKMFALALLALLFATSIALASEKIVLPKGDEKASIILQATGIDYEVYTKDKLDFIRFTTDYEGVLIWIHVVRNDTTIFKWDKSEGLDNGSSDKDLAKLRQHFKKVALLASFADFKIGETRDNDASLWRTKATSGYGDDEQIVLGAIGELYTVIVKRSDFLFMPPQEGSFRLGRKVGKLVALVEHEGKWFIPATDYYARIGKVAEKK